MLPIVTSREAASFLFGLDLAAKLCSRLRILQLNNWQRFDKVAESRVASIITRNKATLTAIRDVRLTETLFKVVISSCAALEELDFSRLERKCWSLVPRVTTKSFPRLNCLRVNEARGEPNAWGEGLREKLLLAGACVLCLLVTQVRFSVGNCVVFQGLSSHRSSLDQLRLTVCSS